MNANTHRRFSLTRRLAPLAALVVIGLLAVLLVACDDEEESGDVSALESRQETLEQSVAQLQETNTALQAALEGRAETPTGPTETPLPSLFPTPRIEQAIVVEQPFERGHMFWFRESRLIWVVVGDDVDPTSGEWLCFEDTFVEGELESDPALDPAADATTESKLGERVDGVQVQQPIRGFGKLWRENEALRERLGWALLPEIEYPTARREYVAGGVLDAQNNYTPAPGEWRLFSIYGDSYVFLEQELGASCPQGTWRARR